MRMLAILIITILAAATILVIHTPISRAVTGGVSDSLGSDIQDDKPDNSPVATLAGGCFWCLESEIRALDGVLYTRVGYIGGQTENPTYEQISTGNTGHAEAVEITFNPEKISYEELIDFFLTKAHDPTQLNRQGVDVGTQYRSEIFYHNQEQKDVALNAIKTTNDKSIYNKPIVTKVSPASTFWTGETYHQQYYEKYEEKTGKVHPRVIYKKGVKMLK